MKGIIKKVEQVLSKELDLEEDELKEFIQLAKDSLKSNFSELDMALNKDDKEMIAKKAHTIKGVLLNLGLEEEANLAKKIELEAKSNVNKEKIEKMIEKLKEALKELIN
ncbi:Hpt domain-containing protein [Thermodesulfobacterium hydrogeniphilum]|uniref:Hpt domain-containing protein n=1 Tax=Thermodesulfobacterium hydrogeniphilum TaxID=161156 RepID=UPI00056E0A4B|nr:Hpt domain-containing protein [Thermodesulfobacterium hydrogeniphilum]